MKIRRPEPGVLQLSHSRAGAFVMLGSYFLFFGAWYSSLVYASRGDGFKAPFLLELLFWVVPLLALPEVLRQAGRVLRGETFILNRATGSIERNGVRRAGFEDVERVQIRTIKDTDCGNSWRLSIVLKNEEKIRIDHSGREEDILDSAEDMADLLDVEITRKHR